MTPSCRYWLSHPLAVNLGSAVISAVLTWYVFLPGCRLLVLAVRRALFLTVTWYTPFFEAADESFLASVWAPVPFLTLASFLVIRWILASAVPPWKRRHAADVCWPLRWGAGVAGALVMIPSGVAFGLLAYTTLSWYGGDLSPKTLRGAAAQRTHCSSCHSPDLGVPLHVIRSPDQWEAIVQRMRDQRGVELGEGQAEAILAFDQAWVSYPDARVFRGKCLQCHDRATLEATPRTAEEWSMIVDRVARVSPFAYRADWTAQLHRYTAAELAVEASAAVGGEIPRVDKVLFERNCGACHTLERIARPGALEPDAATVVRRMEDKVEGRVVAGETERLAGIAATLSSQPAALGALFPHDRPVEVLR